MNTRQSIIEHIQGKGFNADEAMKIYNVYTREKIIQIDKHGGGWSYSHAVFADRGVMNNALNADKKPAQQTAHTIIDQLGGMGKLTAMVGAYNFVALDSGLQFSFRGTRKANKCIVRYDQGSNLYTFELWQIYPKSNKIKKVYSLDGVYFDMLIDLFQDYTGLRLSL